jgi:uncharacterized protein YbbK (DUF523 family)
MEMGSPIRIGVSSCLLGNRVRYDGGHKLDLHVAELLAEHFDLVPVCPEVECGLPVPREPMRLEGDPEDPRLMAIETRVDLTEKMLEYCDWKVRELQGAGICGFVFKSKSPNCGLRVGVHNPSPVGRGSGLFAAAVIRHFPRLPVVEEGGIDDTALRESFIREVISFRDGNRLHRGKR